MFYIDESKKEKRNRLLYNIIMIIVTLSISIIGTAFYFNVIKKIFNGNFHFSWDSFNILSESTISHYIDFSETLSPEYHVSIIALAITIWTICIKTSYPSYIEIYYRITQLLRRHSDKNIAMLIKKMKKQRNYTYKDSQYEIALISLELLNIRKIYQKLYTEKNIISFYPLYLL